MLSSPNSVAVLDRTLARCAESPETGCWEWRGYRRPDGYGVVGVGRKVRLAHRVTYEAMRAEIPVGLELDHLCRVRACVNPWHLEPVTHAVNVSRGGNALKTRCPQGHPYDEENTYVSRRGGRNCRACKRERFGYQGNPVPAQRTHCPRGHEYTDANTYVSRQGSRNCRACQRERERLARSRKKAPHV